MSAGLSAVASSTKLAVSPGIYSVENCNLESSERNNAMTVLLGKGQRKGNNTWPDLTLQTTTLLEGSVNTGPKQTTSRKVTRSEAYKPLFAYLCQVEALLKNLPAGVKVFSIDWGCSDSVDGEGLVIFDTKTREIMQVGSEYHR